MSPRNDLPANWTKKWPECDPLVAQAISAVYSNMSNSHSWNSKKFSFSSLMRKHLDHEVEKYFQRYEVFAGTLSFSEQLKRGENQIIHWLDVIADFLPLGKDFNDEREHKSFVHTISSLRDLVIVCAMFKSKDGLVWTSNNGDEGGGIVRKRARRSKGKTNLDKQPWYFIGFLELDGVSYCELCDQPSSYYDLLNDYKNESGNTKLDEALSRNPELKFQIKGSSRRYCKNHDPDLYPKEYNRAGRRRKAFYSLMCIKREGEKILNGRSKTMHRILRNEAYQIIQSSSLKDLKIAETIVERFFSTSPESILEEETRKNDMLNIYRHYFESLK
jgi:hypothetical protein